MNRRNAVVTTTLLRRTHVYLCSPAAYEISGCECGNADPEWSEFQGHLWCAACQIDFVPQHSGVFDGPIPVQGMTLLGLPVDRMLNLQTLEVEQTF